MSPSLSTQRSWRSTEKLRGNVRFPTVLIYPSPIPPLITEALQNRTRRRCSRMVYKNFSPLSFTTTCASLVSRLRDRNRSCPRDSRARARPTRAHPRPSISRFRERVVAGCFDRAIVAIRIFSSPIAGARRSYRGAPGLRPIRRIIAHKSVSARRGGTRSPTSTFKTRRS